MYDKAMDIDPSQDHFKKKAKAEAFQSINTGPLPSSISKLSGSSRAIPSYKDFHFYCNFDDFKAPIKEIDKKSQLLLGKIGSSAKLWETEMGFPEDLDDAHDWLVNVNDEVLGWFDVSVDEFRSAGKKEEESRVRVKSPMDSDDWFQVVYGKKSEIGTSVSQVVERGRGEEESSSAVKVASRDKKGTGTMKPKISFHIPTINKPQDEYKILVNNSNQPFEHVWLQRSEDGSRFIHPLEMFSFLDFVYKHVADVEPEKPPPIECTPFKLVEEVKDLKELAAKLRGVDEFAVDLEHNQYRSFQGLTCLMQISTRTEDFVLDTLKLRIHIGPYLREVFKDPSKRKVLHGADRDIIWLQQDFGIYICNMFDTGQASRVLKLERNSLEYLLHHFCGVTANKEYQNADWRLRPLPNVMLRYAREDTHYLLHIYDLMRMRLLSLSNESEDSDTPLVEVYKRSYDICMQLYEKEILTDSSYLHIYGVQDANFNAQQLAVVAGLCEWRDVVARAEDESTGYIMPNKALLDIAKQMPLTASNLHRLVRSKYSYVERNLGSVVSIVRHSIQNAPMFEAAAKHLKEARMEKASGANIVVTGGSETVPSEAPSRLKTAIGAGSNYVSNATNDSLLGNKVSSGHPCENGNLRSEVGGSIAADTNMNVSHSVTESTIQVLKKPIGAFGALLGNSAKRKPEPGKMEKEDIKLEQIKSSVNLPFHSSLGGPELRQSVLKEPAKPLEVSHRQEPVADLATISNSVDIILLESDDDDEAVNLDVLHQEEPVADLATTTNTVEIISLESDDDEEAITRDSQVGGDQLEREDIPFVPSLEMDEGDENMSLSDLSSSFQKCFQPINQTKARQGGKSQECKGMFGAQE